MTSSTNKLLSADVPIKQQWKQEKPGQIDKRRCYVCFESSESDGDTLSTRSHSITASASNEKVSEILKKNKINQKPEEQSVFKKRSFCTLF